MNITMSSIIVKDHNIIGDIVYFNTGDSSVADIRFVEVLQFPTTQFAVGSMKKTEMKSNKQIKKK